MRSSYQGLQLPNNFAQLLLDRQIAVKLTLQPLHKNICSLLQLYSQGFEYYQSLGNYKFKYFQIRMNEIFQMKQNQYKKLQQLTELTNLQETNKKEFDKQHSDFDSKRTSFKQQYLNAVEIDTKLKASTQSIQQLIRVSQQKKLQVNMRMKHEIDFQYRLLQRKLHARQCRSSVSLGAGKCKLKQNETKTSLRSQPGKSKELAETQRTHIFQNMILENQQQFEPLPVAKRYTYQEFGVKTYANS